MAANSLSEVRSGLVPGGKLRAGINYGNFLLASKDAATGEPHGIAVELSHEIARRLGVSVEFITFDAAGRMADAVTNGVWDIAFLANEPERASQILFTPPYLEIDAGYLVPPGSRIQSIADADREGLRIAIAENSAYDLFLSRSLRHAKLVRAKGMDGSYDLFAAERPDLLAGIKPWLMIAAGNMPGSRVLDGRFMAVQQCIGAPKGRDPVAWYLCEFVEDVKASGFLSETVRRLGLRGVSIAG